MLKTLKRRRIRIGPEDDGKRMRLEDFDRAIAHEGYLYELNQGVIEVSDIPGLEHGRQVDELRQQLALYRAANPDAINYVAAGSDAKLLIETTQSERHPDLLLYTSSAPETGDVWSSWVPTVAIEVVSARSAKRDYQDKPDEYLEFGVSEYWIVDAAKLQMTALTRWRGQWKKRVVKSSQKYTTGLLTGFSLDLKKVFAATKKK